MIDLIEGAGIFIYPLGLCSLFSVYIVLERLFSLRSSSVLPVALEQQLLSGNIELLAEPQNTMERVLFYFEKAKPDSEQLKAYARLQVLRLERGMFILDSVIAAAPLIGLLGTVTGLIKVFAGIDPTEGMPDPGAFIEGVALALTTTMIGLSIAIPSLVLNSYLNRKIDTHSARIEVCVEYLIEQQSK